MKRIFIKASRLTNLTDARYFAAKDVQFLGFNLEAGTPGYLDPMYMRAIREWVQGPLIVGEYAHAPVAEVREAAAFFGLDAVQVTAQYGPDLLQLAGLTVLLTVDADQDAATLEDLFRQAAPYVRHFILQFSTKNDIETSLGYEAEFWKKICTTYSVLLHWDGLAADLPGLLETWPLAGLSLTGGDEQQVGVKSFDEIEEIFEWLEGE
jgi:phosphoribosylanthranilate isomerase